MIYLDVKRLIEEDKLESIKNALLLLADEIDKRNETLKNLKDETPIE